MSPGQQVEGSGAVPPSLGKLFVLFLRVLGDDPGVELVAMVMVVLILCGKRVPLALAASSVLLFFVVGSVDGVQEVTRVCIMDYLVPS